jgi:hypothetical protein
VLKAEVCSLGYWQMIMPLSVFGNIRRGKLVNGIISVLDILLLTSLQAIQ